MAKSWCTSITKLYLSGHTLQEIREYPISRLKALTEIIEDIENTRDAHSLHLNSLAAQGTEKAISTTKNILLGKQHG